MRTALHGTEHVLRPKDESRRKFSLHPLQNIRPPSVSNSQVRKTQVFSVLLYLRQRGMGVVTWPVYLLSHGPQTSTKKKEQGGGRAPPPSLGVRDFLHRASSSCERPPEKSLLFPTSYDQRFAPGSVRSPSHEEKPSAKQLKFFRGTRTFEHPTSTLKNALC